MMRRTVGATVRSTRALRAPVAMKIARNFSASPATKSSSLKLAASAGVLATGLAWGMSQEAQAAAGADYGALRARIEALLEDENAVNPGKDGFPGAKGGGGYVGPMLVRLAWHCAGTYSVAANNGGSDGATMRFKPESDHGGNAGLGNARALLEPLKKEFPGVTYADLYIFAGCVAIEAMGGPTLPFRPGRSDAPASAAPEKDSRFSPDGRLPDAFRDDVPLEQHVRDIFYRMGFNDQEIVALSGAHALGHCHTDRSGFWGPWTYSPQTFSNEYYRLLEDEKWSVKKTHEGKAWSGPPQYENENGKLMMLYSDIALVWDPRFRKHVLAYKANEDKFFSDFAAAWTKLTELGCKNLGSAVSMGGVAAKPWYQFW